MKTDQLVRSLALFTAIATVAACGKPDKPDPAVDKAPSAPPQAPVAGQVNAPIPPGSIDLALTTIEGPAYDPSADTLTYKIRVTNNGKVMIASAGRHAVNLGVVILGADGSPRTPPGTRGFVRLKFPKPLAQGQSIELPFSFKVERTIGGRVVVDGVQEGVRWFSDYHKPVLELGSFKRCGEVKASACTADGTAVPLKK